MTAKHSSKSRKGLLPPAVASKKAKSPKKVPVSSEQKGAAFSASPTKKSNSTAAKKPEHAKIDKYTGKKKGTLFSSAPSPAAKVSEAVKKNKASKTHNTCLQKPLSNSNAARVDAKGEQTRSKKAEHTVAGPVDCVAQIKSKKKWQRKKAKDAAKPDEVAPPSNKGATGKSNWERLKTQALEQSEVLPSKTSQSQSTGHKAHKKRKRQRADDPQNAARAAERLAASSEGVLDGKLVPKNGNTDKTEIVALDCEMVGVGNSEGRKRDALARASLINDAGNVLLDVWVRPKEKVTDFRFHVTGIKWSDLKDGISVEEASHRIHEFTKDSILVGHAVHNDIKVLNLQGTIPRNRIRDTALYPPLMGVRKATGKLFSKSLKHVTEEELGIKIQKDEHDPVQDARAALYVYHKHRQVWEMQVSTGSVHQPGVRTSAKLTRGVPQQKRMRADKDDIHTPKPHMNAQGTKVGDAEAGSDDEFAPPDALAVARMKAKLKGDTLEDHMADL